MRQQSHCHRSRQQILQGGGLHEGAPAAAACSAENFLNPVRPSGRTSIRRKSSFLKTRSSAAAAAASVASRDALLAPTDA